MAFFRPNSRFWSRQSFHLVQGVDDLGLLSQEVQTQTESWLDILSRLDDSSGRDSTFEDEAMPKEQNNQPQVDLLQGTLDMLILLTLLFGPAHGHRMYHSIKNVSQDVLYVDHGSLYPALQRLERRGWISSSWGTSENNRR